jgi:hypothetical protein
MLSGKRSDAGIEVAPIPVLECQVDGIAFWSMGAGGRFPFTTCWAAVHRRQTPTSVAGRVYTQRDNRKRFGA